MQRTFCRQTVLTINRWVNKEIKLSPSGQNVAGPPPQNPNWPRKRAASKLRRGWEGGEAENWPHRWSANVDHSVYFLSSHSASHLLSLPSRLHFQWHQVSHVKPVVIEFKFAEGKLRLQLMVHCLCSDAMSHKPLGQAGARFAVEILLCIGLHAKHSATLRRPLPQHMYEKLHRKKNAFDVCRPSARKEVRKLSTPVSPLGALLQRLPQQLFRTFQSCFLDSSTLVPRHAHSWMNAKQQSLD